jgi:RNA polymerase sigma-70 factor (ECF subfamily)
MARELRNEESLLEDARWIETILTGRDQGEREACFARLMKKYWKLVVVLVTSRIRDPREAEDVAQEVFVRSFTSLPRLAEPVAFLGWLLRIARNLATDRLRSRRPTVSLEAMGGAAEEHAFWAADGSPAAFTRDLETAEEVTRALKALEELPEKYREVVALKYLQGLDGKTMAALLGEPEGTVRNRLFRALEKLREALSPDSNLRSAPPGGRP